MNEFPRTKVGGVSLSRMIIGTNWFLGWSHTTAAKDQYIKENVGADRTRLPPFLRYSFVAASTQSWGRSASESEGWNCRGRAAYGGESDRRLNAKPAGDGFDTG